MKLELFQHNHANSNFSFAPLLSHKTAPTNTNNKLGVSMCGRQLYCACVLRRNNCNLPIPIIIDVDKLTIFEIGEIIMYWVSALPT